MKEIRCKSCDKPGHYKYQCFQNRKPIKQRGKQAIKWTDTRAEWFEQNDLPVYECYLCGKKMEREETTLDHVIPRSRAPELRYEMSNLRPCCWSCNSTKGSKVY